MKNYSNRETNFFHRFFFFSAAQTICKESQYNRILRSKNKEIYMYSIHGNKGEVVQGWEDILTTFKCLVALNCCTVFREISQRQPQQNHVTGICKKHLIGICFEKKMHNCAKNFMLKILKGSQIMYFHWDDSSFPLSTLVQVHLRWHAWLI